MSQPNQFTANIEARDTRITQLTNQGQTAELIAETLHISERTVQRSRRRTGIAQPPHKHMTPQQIDHAAAMLADGACKQDVAQTVGVSVVTIYHRFPNTTSWTKQQVAEYREMQKKLAAL